MKKRVTLLFSLFAIVSHAQDHESPKPGAAVEAAGQETRRLLEIKNPKQLEEAIVALRELNGEQRKELLEIYLNPKKYGYGAHFRAEEALARFAPEFSADWAKKVLFESPNASSEERSSAVSMLRRSEMKIALLSLGIRELKSLFTQLDSIADYGLRLRYAGLLRELIPTHSRVIEEQVQGRLGRPEFRSNPAVEQLFEVAQYLPRRLDDLTLRLHLSPSTSLDASARTRSARAALNYLGSHSGAAAPLESGLESQIRELKKDTDFGVQLAVVRAVQNLSARGEANFLDLIVAEASDSNSKLSRDYISALGRVSENSKQFASQYETLSVDQRQKMHQVLVSDLRNSSPRIGDGNLINLYAISQVYSHPGGVEAGRQAVINEMAQMSLPATQCEFVSGPKSECRNMSSRERAAAILDIGVFGGLPIFTIFEATSGSRPGLSSTTRRAMADAIESSSLRNQNKK